MIYLTTICVKERFPGWVTTAPLRRRRHRRFPDRCLPRIAVRKRARTKALKTAVKPILKSLRSLSLAAQIDVRPCFTFNSIGQKTAICWRDAAGTALSMPAHCADDSPRAVSLLRFLWTRPTCLLSIRTDLQLGARGKGRSLELSAGTADTKLSLSITRPQSIRRETFRLQPRGSPLSSPFHPFTLSLQRTVIRGIHRRDKANPLSADYSRRWESALSRNI